jgi:hypothetical protein
MEERKMKKRINFCLVISVLFVFTSANAFGGFGLPKIGGKKGGTSVSKDDVINQQSDLVKKYITYSLKITDAQILMAQAFDFKEEKEKLEAQKIALESGNVISKDEIEKQRELTEDTQKKIDEHMEKCEELSDEGKKYYQKSLIPYFEGVLIAKQDVVPSAKKCIDGANNVIKSASMMEKLKLKKTFDTVLYLGPKVGPDLKNLTSTGSKYITYAKKNKVKIPKKAEEILGDL